MTCSKSGKRKSVNSKKSCCPFSLVYKKAYLGTNDPKMHPAYDGTNGDEICKDKCIQVGIYFLSKFRPLHNHPLELGYVFAGYDGVDGKEREVQGKYESDALDDLLSSYQTKHLERIGHRHLMKFKAAVHEIYLINPEAGLPYIV